MNPLSWENTPIFTPFSLDGNALKTMMNDHLTKIQDQIQNWIDRKPQEVHITKI